MSWKNSWWRAHRERKQADGCLARARGVGVPSVVIGRTIATAHVAVFCSRTVAPVILSGQSQQAPSPLQGCIGPELRELRGAAGIC